MDRLNQKNGNNIHHIAVNSHIMYSLLQLHVFPLLHQTHKFSVYGCVKNNFSPFDQEGIQKVLFSFQFSIDL